MTRRPTPSIIDAVLTADVLPDRTALRGRLRWDYSQVAPVDRKAVEDAAVDILANGQRLQQSAVAIGERLQSVKRLLPHGQFGSWCATEFAMSQKTAENLMNVAREFGDKIETVSILTDSAMYMLAAPSTPPAARDQAIQEAQDTGKSPTKKRVSEIIAEHKPGPAVQPIPTPTAKEYDAAVQAAQPARTVASYAKLCILIEDEIAPTCDLYTVDRRWLAEHIEDRLHQRDMTADTADIAQAIQDTAEELRQKEQRERRLAVARAAAEEADRQHTIDVLPPISRQLVPHTADEPADAEPAPRIRGYNVLDDYALRDMPAPANAYDALAVPDGRISAARHLMALYGAVIDSEEQYGELTGRFSDTLTVKRELTHMITHLSDLIAIIEHPEEVSE